MRSFAILMSAQTKKFELPGSKPNYPAAKQFAIRHLKLEIRPDFDERKIACRETLDISVIEDGLRSVVLDATELNIRSVRLDGKELRFGTLEDKLRIELPSPASEGQQVLLVIDYEARPRRGFFFVGPDKNYPNKHLQAWTQGEATESRYWFPCFDHPDMKFTSEVIAEVPSNFVAISNGKLVNVTKGKSVKYHWVEEHPHPAYLTSLAIGDFTEVRESYDGIELLYYVPKEMKDSAELSFENTVDMLKFFEQYVGVKYPFDKYSQVAVDDFVYGGMENVSATTLTADTLHDKKAHLDFTSDHLVSHELAHQWFGDLVTCRDWQHIWLNESFATYFEALYWQHSRGDDEFNYYVMQLAEEYFDEASKRYRRAIVTNVYKHPDDLFDRHTYEKGACVLHMLRSLVGDGIFRRAVKNYVAKFANGNAETDDFRRCVEEVSGQSLQQFFEQWLLRPGHPELKVEFGFDHTSKIATIRVAQTQNTDDGTPIYRLPLDIRIYGDDEQEFTFTIDSKEQAFHIPLDFEPRWFSVDPHNKILKRLDVKAPQQMLIEQLRNGSTVERIYAAKTLSNFSSQQVVDALREVMMAKKNSVFWGLAAECARALSSIKTDAAHSVLVEALKLKHPKARRAVVKALGEFKKEDNVAALVPLLQEDESYFVQAESALALGKSRSRKAIPFLLKALGIRSFNAVITANALTGFGELKDDLGSHILVERTRLGEHHRVREAAALALGKFVKDNDTVFEHLTLLLKDPWFRVRINAIKAFVEAQEPKAIPELERVAKNDLDPRVRRVADEGVASVRESMRVPREVTEMREEVEKLKTMNHELVQKIDTLERELKG